jgi:hypothetical protein
MLSDEELLRSGGAEVVVDSVAAWVDHLLGPTASGTA